MKITKLKKTDKVQYEFKCNICSKIFLDKSLLQQHKKIHNKAMYNCQLCSYSGKTVKSLSSHVRKVHTEPTIPCEICGKKFHFQCKLKQHLLVHSGAKPHKCKVCGKGFNSTYSLGTHELIHYNLKPYKCTICDYACRDSSTLRKHVDRHQGKVKRYPCQLCPRLFNASIYLRMHIEETHLGANVHTKPCDFCGKMFKSNSTLTLHVKTIHGREYECKCDVCGIVCMDKGHLRAHMISHVDIRPYICTYKSCGKKFKCMGDLKKHTVLHYPEQQYTCFCGRRFARKYRYDNHTRLHKEKTAQCDICGDWFNSKSQVALHISKEHTDRRYICDVCGFQTKNKTNIVKHIKKEHNEYSCKICGKTFKNHINLKQHNGKCNSITYETKPRLKHAKFLEGIDIKEEIENVEEMDLLEVDKKEIVSDTNENEENHNKHEKAINSIQIPTKELNKYDKVIIINNDQSLIENIKRINVSVRIDKKAKQNADKHIQELLDKSIRKKELKDLEETRRVYNERIKKAIKNKPKGPIIKFMKINNNIIEKEIKQNESQNNDSESQNNDSESQNNDSESQNNNSESQNNDSRNNDNKDSNDNEVARNKKLKINTHQCYVCFKLFETKPQLLDHCDKHFDICCNVMLKKCPLCDYVTKSNLSKHMLLKHKINIKLPFPRFNDTKHNKDGSRYYYDIKNKNIDKIEIIPSVKNLNKIESIKIDKKRKIDKELSINKKKLIKKGNEWIIEDEKINLNETFLIPKFNIEDLIKIKVIGDDYLSRLKKLSRLAKLNGKKILFPCENCEKICQTLSALKLHTRKHNPNAKPFKQKVWKHKNGNKTEKKKIINTNRFEKPKPIINKHKCDTELMEFYENNIKGGDIEFWQFLKIYNKMTRENINEFSELNKRTDFGIHYDEPLQEVTKVKEKKELRQREIRKKEVGKKTRFSRVVKMSKKLYLRRMELKNKLRQNVNACS